MRRPAMRRVPFMRSILAAAFCAIQARDLDFGPILGLNRRGSTWIDGGMKRCGDGKGLSFFGAFERQSNL